MKTIFKVLTYVVFPIAIIVLVYLNYESIMEPVRRPIRQDTAGSSRPPTP